VFVREVGGVYITVARKERKLFEGKEERRHLFRKKKKKKPGQSRKYQRKSEADPGKKKARGDSGLQKTAESSHSERPPIDHPKTVTRHQGKHIKRGGRVNDSYIENFGKVDFHTTTRLKKKGEEGEKGVNQGGERTFSQRETTCQNESARLILDTGREKKERASPQKNGRPTW